jgi:hypothetical protein
MKRTYFDIDEGLQKRLKFRALEEDLPLMHGATNIVNKAVEQYLAPAVGKFEGQIVPGKKIISDAKYNKQVEEASRGLLRNG